MIGAHVPSPAPADHERAYAELAILLLRENNISDAEILTDYCRPCPQADRAMEAQYQRETGMVILASNVKKHMRRLLCN